MLFCNTNNDTHTNNDTLVSDKSSSNILGDVQYGNEPHRQLSKQYRQQQKQSTLNIKKRQRQHSTPTNYYISYYTMISLLIISTITWYQSHPLYVSSLSTTSNNYSNMRQISILKGTTSSGNNQLLVSRRRSNALQRNKQTKLYQLGAPPAFGGQAGGQGAGGTPSFGGGGASTTFGGGGASTSFGKSPGGGFGAPAAGGGFGKQSGGTPSFGGGGFGKQSGFGQQSGG